MPLDISSWTGIEVRIQFTDQLDPQALAEGSGVTMVSLLTEIEANQPTQAGDALREKHGRIPYSSPLYLWEVVIDGASTTKYIGQTVHLQIQKRFESHANVVRLLARYVNDPAATVHFRLCSRLDLRQPGGDAWRPLEWVVPEQAAEVVTDVESMLIFQHQPEFNIHYRGRPRTPPWRPLLIKALVFGRNA
jgi:hypothetical protein